jgi:shikimate kinase
MKTEFGKDLQNKQNKPRVVEIVGPAGAGKTTLCQMLSCCNDIRLGNFPNVRKAACIPFFIRYGLQILSAVILKHPGNLKELGWREFAWLSILSGWPHVLQGEVKKHNDLIVLDQGPVFLLSEMNLFGPYFLRTKTMQGLWRNWYRQWSTALDAVVWLDAPDECLQQRIRTREKDHLVKDKSAQAVSKFLKDYRRTYQNTFSALAINHGCFKVLRFDTSRHAPEEIAAQVFCEFDLQTIPSVDC